MILALDVGNSDIVIGCIENGKIISADGKMPYDREILVEDGYILPGFIDIHTHGAVDHDFVSSSPDEIVEAVKYHATHGTTSIMPTISSYGYETTYKALENLEIAMKGSNAEIDGVELDGEKIKDPAALDALVSGTFSGLVTKGASFNWSAPVGDGAKKTSVNDTMNALIRGAVK